jgi:tetratricopeptide (TPR) repeat protein
MFDLFRNKTVKNIEIARNYFRKGNLKKAANMCIELLGENEFNLEALHLLSEIYLRDNDLYKYKNICLKLIDVYIENNNYNSSIALLKKLIKKFPDDIEIYNKMVIVYEKSNMRKETIQTLFVLGDLYLKKDMYTEASEVFVKLLNYNKLDKSIDVCFEVINRFVSLDNKMLINLAVKDCMSYAKESGDKEALNKLIDIAAKYDCDIGQNIKDSLEYFKSNKSNLSYFVKHCINYFINICTALDMEFYKRILNSFDYDEIGELVKKIHDKYKNLEVYKVGFEIFSEKNDTAGLRYILERLYTIEDPSKDQIDFLVKGHEKIKDPRILYSIALYLIRCKNNIAANIILKKALEIANGDEEIKKQIEDRLDELANITATLELKEPKVRNLEDTTFKKMASIDDLKEKEEELPEIEVIFEDKKLTNEVKEEVEKNDLIYSQALELIKNKSYKKAIEILMPLIGTSNDFNILFNIGLCYEGLKEYDRAIEFYKKAIELTRDVQYKSKLLIKITDIYFDMRDKEKTYETLYEVYKINPGAFKYIFN